MSKKKVTKNKIKHTNHRQKRTKKDHPIKNRRRPLVRFIDLFSGLGGIRLGFEQAFAAHGFETKCVFTSEIKAAAIRAHELNFPGEEVQGDITKIPNAEIPEFEFLLAGFPCQAFSKAGKQRGFTDTRGTLFFEVERILEDKRPWGFILENVKGLVFHDKEKSDDKIGRTLSTILEHLEDLGYEVTWKVLPAESFGVPQIRDRIYIVGTLRDAPISLDDFPVTTSHFSDVMQHGLPTVNSDFTRKLFAHFTPEQVLGKAIRDKRGGDGNIHSWQIGLRGDVTDEEMRLLNALLLQRRKHSWAEIIGIDWQDGMALTTEQISTFFESDHLQEMLTRLTDLGYLSYEHPKKKVLVSKKTSEKTSQVYDRIPDETLPKGYNIVTGRLSFEFSRIFSPNEVVPTVTAMDMSRMGVVDGAGLRCLTLKEGLGLFGYPETYSLACFEGADSNIDDGYDVLGNTVCVPVIKAVSERLAVAYEGEQHQ